MQVKMGKEGVKSLGKVMERANQQGLGLELAPQIILVVVLLQVQAVELQA